MTNTIATSSPSSPGSVSFSRRPGGTRLPEPDKLYDERVISVDRVARVVKGGRRFRFRALVVLGNHKGRVGVGLARGADVTLAVSKATEVAKKQMIDIKLKNGTLIHDCQERSGGANVLIKPAAPGTGLIAGGVVRTVLEVAGVGNAISKSLGSSNKVNVAYAALAGLNSLPRSSGRFDKRPQTNKSTYRAGRVKSL